jgi:hypothetical protein
MRDQVCSELIAQKKEEEKIISIMATLYALAHALRPDQKLVWMTSETIAAAGIKT